MKKFFIIVVCIALIVVAAFLYSFWRIVRENLDAKLASYTTTPVSVGTLTVLADVADTDPLRIQGLSGRKNLSDGTGMLFIFPQSGFYGFWMKDMHFSIDIIGFDDTKHVVWLEEDLLPESYPTVFTPERPVSFVLEVPAGTIQAFEVKLGAQGTFK